MGRSINNIKNLTLQYSKVRPHLNERLCCITHWHKTLLRLCTSWTSVVSPVDFHNQCSEVIDFRGHHPMRIEKETTSTSDERWKSGCAKWGWQDGNLS
ncbi:hypothetical protein CEXT_71611 [Caerostris extrusa]|uniref:Uncharacterized protein n=1 Tax=Caerostris extrusa TaxID=172846 RepID=A0AAV4XFP8_CAEEX|nr:hypothetical protein CEXT_71611 [Caerostris extrusa]